MSNNVYFIDLRATNKINFVSKLKNLMEAAGLKNVVAKRDLTAVKIHFGEYGNTAFIRPVYIRKIVETIKKAGGIPFLTDANTLYVGTRSDSVHHVVTAIQNGFAYSVVEAPIIIADGLRGKSETAVAINQQTFQTVYIGNEIVEADALISVAHFKGHELSGFGGAIKNTGMGCASRRGKMAQHSELTPKVSRKKCIGCGDCIPHCSQGAISLIDEKAAFDREKCIGCGECLLACPNDAINIQWDQYGESFLKKMVEYTYGVLKDKKGKALFINFITNVSPACDCVSFNDAPIVADIGVAASIDPVAVDQASVDLVNNQPALANSCLTTHLKPGEDKIRGIYPKVNWEIQLDYAAELHLGKRDYKLVKL